MGASSCSNYDAAAKSPENQSQPPTSTRQFRHLQLTGNQIDGRSTAPQPSNSVGSVLARGAASDSTAIVTVYKVNKLCQTLKPETVTGQDNQLMSSVVNEVLK